MITSGAISAATYFGSVLFTKGVPPNRPSPNRLPIIFNEYNTAVCPSEDDVKPRYDVYLGTSNGSADYGDCDAAQFDTAALFTFLAENAWTLTISLLLITSIGAGLYMLRRKLALAYSTVTSTLSSWFSLLWRWLPVPLQQLAKNTHNWYLSIYVAVAAEIIALFLARREHFGLDHFLIHLALALVLALSKGGQELLALAPLKGGQECITRSKKRRLIVDLVKYHNREKSGQEGSSGFLLLARHRVAAPNQTLFSRISWRPVNKRLLSEEIGTASQDSYTQMLDPDSEWDDVMLLAEGDIDNLREATSKLRDLKKQVEHLEAKLEEAEGDIVWQDAVKYQEPSAQELSSIIDDMNEKLSAATAARDATTEKLNDLETRYNLLSGEHATLEKAYNRSQRSEKSEEKRLAKMLEKMLENERDERGRRQKDNERINQEFDRYEAKIAKQTVDNKSLQMEVEQLKHKLQASDTGADEKLGKEKKELKMESTKFRDENGELRAKLLDKDAALEESQSSLGQLRSKLSEHEEALEEEQKLHNATKEQARQETSRVSETETQLQASNAAHAAKETELVSTKQELAGVQSQIRAYHDTFVSGLKTHEALQHEYQRMKSAAENYVRDLESQLEQMHQELNAWKSKTVLTQTVGVQTDESIDSTIISSSASENGASTPADHGGPQSAVATQAGQPQQNLPPSNSDGSAGPAVKSIMPMDEVENEPHVPEAPQGHPEPLVSFPGFNSPSPRPHSGSMASRGSDDSTMSDVEPENSQPSFAPLISRGNPGRSGGPGLRSPASVFINKRGKARSRPHGNAGNMQSGPAASSPLVPRQDEPLFSQSSFSFSSNGVATGAASSTDANPFSKAGVSASEPAAQAPTAISPSSGATARTSRAQKLQRLNEIKGELHSRRLDRSDAQTDLDQLGRYIIGLEADEQDEFGKARKRQDEARKALKAMDGEIAELVAKRDALEKELEKLDGEQCGSTGRKDDDDDDQGDDGKGNGGSGGAGDHGAKSDNREGDMDDDGYDTEDAADDSGQDQGPKDINTVEGEVKDLQSQQAELDKRIAYLEQKLPMLDQLGRDNVEPVLRERKQDRSKVVRKLKSKSSQLERLRNEAHIMSLWKKRTEAEKAPEEPIAEDAQAPSGSLLPEIDGVKFQRLNKVLEVKLEEKRTMDDEMEALIEKKDEEYDLYGDNSDYQALMQQISTKKSGLQILLQEIKEIQETLDDMNFRATNANDGREDWEFDMLKELSN